MAGRGYSNRSADIEPQGIFRQDSGDQEATSIFVAPNGLGDPPMWSQGAKDHTLFDDLVKLVDSDLCIDRARLFSLGFSYGAMFSNSLAQTHQDVLRGSS
jgi:poly(3-hydroxybutyrate) depolymerase